VAFGTIGWVIQEPGYLFAFSTYPAGIRLTRNEPPDRAPLFFRLVYRASAEEQPVSCIGWPLREKSRKSDHFQTKPKTSDDSHGTEYMKP